MYIDKLYTKLYSDKDWEGLNQLIGEIRTFAKKDYEGLGLIGKMVQKYNRNKAAKEIKKVRSGKSKPENPYNPYNSHMSDDDYIDWFVKQAHKDSDARRDKWKERNYIGKGIDRLGDRLKDRFQETIDELSDAPDNLRKAGSSKYYDLEDSLDTLSNKWGKFKNRFRDKWEKRKARKLDDDLYDHLSELADRNEKDKFIKDALEVQADADQVRGLYSKRGK